MNLYSNKQRWKLVLFVVALVIIAIAIWYASYITKKVRDAEIQRVNNWGETIRKKAELVRITNESFIQIAESEQQYVEMWVGAMQEMQKDLTDYSFPLKVIQSNDTIPLILTENGNFVSSSNLSEEQKHPDSITKYLKEWPKKNDPIEIQYADNKSQIIYYKNSAEFDQLKIKREELIASFNRDLVENIDLVPVLFVDEKLNEVIATNLDSSLIDSPEKLAKVKQEMSLENDPIELELGEGHVGVLYYQESETLGQLRYYPFVILSLIAVFTLVSYLLFSTFRRAEQNQVWVGMAKETAHQLGTPLSSLVAWIELLRSEGVNEDYLSEMEKDLNRLNTVTDRFSKIGSESKLEKLDLVNLTVDNINYLKQRISGQVEITVQGDDQQLTSNLSPSLFSWVIENIVKNGVDAMEGSGRIQVLFGSEKSVNYIEITDTGKGIPNNALKTVFQPGYTTKKRGWGLGLSLARRIIEEHHHGKIFVKSSEVGKGTTFRIEVPKI
ncbi:sensor histidine kinase [Parvicella tangerina]|uniref:histidine kinase n=1 Tax=Parvicella tangerina TaxID=2829795 RepID=A0A916JKL0_9FLAO|nr:ATP-binding protein [Parvicella tangerina]CAG5078574.1 Adaptive-response sensory-kinase SasA [Parvicella tangerina]